MSLQDKIKNAKPTQFFDDDVVADWVDENRMMENIFDEITKRVTEEEDNAIAKAFTMYIADLLNRNGIKPILTKIEAPYEECSDKNEYQLVSRYGYMFERLDTSDHDKQIRDEVIDECNKILKDMYLEIANTVNGNDYTSKNDLVSVVASKCRQYVSNRLKQMKGEQND